MKKTYKILAVALLAVVLVTFLSTNVFASNIINTIEANKDTTAGTNEMGYFGGKILGYITNAAMLISVLMIAVLGLKYMFASAEGKADYKANMIPLVVGAVCVFGAATIAKMIVGLASQF